MSVDNSTTAIGTLTSGDNLDGGQGTDTLQVVATGTPTAPLVSTKNIEVLEVTNNSNAPYTANASLMVGLNTAKVVGGNAATTFANSQGNLNIDAATTNSNIITTSATPSTGSADAISISLSGVGTTTNTSITSDGIETFNVSLAGAASGSTAVGAERTVTLASNELETVNVTGSAAANLVVSLVGANLLAQVGTVNAATATGNLTIAVTPGASSDKKTLVSMGSGNDKVTIGALDKDYTITGGAGNDTLVATAAAPATGLAAAEYVGVGVSGFEIIEAASAGTVDFRSLANNTTFVATTGAGTYTAAGAGIKDSYLTATSGTLTLTRATNGTADSLNVHIQSPTAATVTATVVNEEIVTIAAAGTGVALTHNLTLGVTDATTLNVIGSNGLNITSLTGETNLTTINAGTHTGSTFTVDAADSTKAMTVTGSIGSESTIGGTVNTITTGSGADTVTGGAFKDIITTGLGNDSVVGGAGDDTITTGGGNDTVLGGAGADVINGGTGDDSIDGGDGNDQINAGSGTDTVLGGAGDDRIVVTLSDNTNVDGGTGTDRVSNSTADITATTAATVTAQFISVTESVAPTLTLVEQLHVSVDADAGAAATSAVTLDLTKATSLTTLFMDTDDLGQDSFMKVNNFAGSSITLFGGTNFGSGAEADNIILDGVGQSALTLNLQAFEMVAAGTLGFTGVQALTIAGASKSQLTGSADQDNALGVVTANAVTSLTVSSSGSAAANASALDIASISATAANTLILTVGAFDEMEIDTVTAGTVVETVTLTTGTDSIVDINAIDLSTSAVVRADITLGAGAILSTDGTNAVSRMVDLSATSIADFNVTLGAGAVAGLDLSSIRNTDADFSLDSSSILRLGGTLGLAGSASDFAFTGRGDLDDNAGNNTFNLVGTTVVFNSSGLTVDADALTITSAATVGATITTGLGADVITGGAGNDSITSGVGADTITGGNGNDTLSGGDGADVIYADNGGTKEQQTIVLATNANAGGSTDSIVINGVTIQNVAAGAATPAQQVAAYITTINANAALANIVRASEGATTATLLLTFLVDGPQAVTPAATVGAAGTTYTITDNVVTGLNGTNGNDVLIGGTGADVFVWGGTTGTGGNGAAPSDTVFDTITGYTTASDVLNFRQALTLVAEGTSSATQGVVSATGLVTFHADTAATLAARLAATEAAMTAGTAAAGEAAVFVVGSDSYVFISDGVAGLGANDQLIKLTGVVATTGITLTGGDITAIA